jgi:hypothetical protein
MCDEILKIKSLFIRFRQLVDFTFAFLEFVVLLFTVGAAHGRPGSFGVLVPTAQANTLPTGTTQLSYRIGRLFAYDTLHVFEVHMCCSEL